MNIDVVLRHRSVGLCDNGLWPERDEAGWGEFLLTWWATMEAGIVADTTEMFTNHGVNSRKAVT